MRTTLPTASRAHPLQPKSQQRSGDSDGVKKSSHARSSPSSSSSATASSSSTPPQPSAKQLLQRWEANSQLEDGQEEALAALADDIGRRANDGHRQNDPSRPVEARSQSAEAPAAAQTILEQLVQQQQQRSHTRRKAAQAKNDAEASRAAADINANGPLATPTATPPFAPPLSHSAMSSLLFQSHLYINTPDYIHHLSHVDDEVYGLDSFHPRDDSLVPPSQLHECRARHRTHLRYYLHLRSCSSFLRSLLELLDELDGNSSKMLQHLNEVFAKTNSVREECSNLLAEQQTLAAQHFRLQYHLSYFDEADAIQSKLTDPDPSNAMARFMKENSDGSQLAAAARGSSTSSPLPGPPSNPMLSPDFPHILSTLDTCLEYLRRNNDFLGAAATRERYQSIHANMLRCVRNYFRRHMEESVAMGVRSSHSSSQISKEKNETNTPMATQSSEGDSVYNSHPSWLNVFVQLRALAQTMRPLMLEMEHRAGSNSASAAVSAATNQRAAASSTSNSMPNNTQANGEASTSAQARAYQDLLLDCYHIYTEQRHAFMSSSLQSHLTRLSSSGRPLSSVIRTVCRSWIELCTLESQLFLEFFSPHPAALSMLNEGLLAAFCSMLYITLRPIIIHNADLDALAEAITILKYEIIEEQILARGGNREALKAADHGTVGRNAAAASSSSSSASSSNSAASLDLFPPSSPLHSFGQCLQRLIGDVQERLIFTARMYMRDMIQHYASSQADLDYPNILTRHRAKDEEEKKKNVQADSAIAAASALPTPSPPPSPVVPPSIVTGAGVSRREQLFSTWHPALERTLMLLSKLYRCLDASVFGYMAQEAVSICIQLLQDCSARISARHARVDPQASDGQLFLIKHLLLLREQIQPFSAVHFTLVQKDLDFSHMRDVLPNIFSSVGKWSSFLELVHTSAPRLIENKLDSKKQLEQQLKSACEQLIASQTQYLIGPLLEFFNKMGAATTAGTSSHRPEEFKAELCTIISHMTGRKQGEPPSSSSDPTTVSPLHRSSSSPFSRQLSTLLHQTSLYLSNPLTERILFKPIQRTLMEVFEQLRFFVSTHFPKQSTTNETGSSSAAVNQPMSEEDESTMFLEERIAELERMLRESFVD